MPILHALAKYGAEAFAVEMIEECGTCTQGFLDDREVFWVGKLSSFSPNGYNLRAGQSRGICSEEVKAKIGAANKGRKASEETKRLLSESHLGNRWSQAQKEKASAMMRGKQLSPLARKNSVIACSKSYVIFDPDGVEVVVTNMAAFCRERGLNKALMSMVISGKRRHHCGWTGGRERKGQTMTGKPLMEIGTEIRAGEAGKAQA